MARVGRLEHAGLVVTRETNPVEAFLRVFVTGGRGFIGGALVAKLRARGETVVAAVRDPGRAERLRALGADVVQSDLRSVDALAEAMHASDAVFHLAGDYRIGIPASERPAMYDSNVGATERVIDAATAASVRRVVYVSTINAFGNTNGQVVDETFRRHPAQPFLSWYDETKYRAHEAAERRAAQGAPVVIVQPGAVYGPGDHSGVGDQLRRAYEGRLSYRAFPRTGINLVHVDDVAEGILLAHDRGRVGGSYVLGGEITTLGGAIDVSARLGGHRPPRVTVPTGLLRAVAPLGPLLARVAALPPNLHEVIAASDGVTYWATDAKARAELAYAPADLETGLRRTFVTA